MAHDVLLVECKGCNRRSALSKENGLPIYQGNMDSVRGKPLRCRKCGGTDVRSYIPISEEQVEFFLAGDPVGTMKLA